MDVRDRRLYNYIVKEVDECIVEPDAFIEAGETNVFDELGPCGCCYRVAHCTACTSFNGLLQEFVDHHAVLDQDSH